MVFQEYALYPHMSVYKNMAFGLKLRKFPKSEIDQRVKDAAEILGLQELLHRKPKELSGGQRQPVAVGRAIVRKPAVFLFDEPLSNLDAKLRVQMRAELSKLHDRLQTTMIYVTHDQIEAMTMGTKIVVMKDGLIQQVGPPLEVYNTPVNLFVAGFIGSSVMNFIPCRILSKEGQLLMDAGSFQLPVPEKKFPHYQSLAGSEVIFGIRPNDIYDRAFTPEPIKRHAVRSVIDVIEPLGSEDPSQRHCRSAQSYCGRGCPDPVSSSSGDRAGLRSRPDASVSQRPSTSPHSSRPVKEVECHGERRWMAGVTKALYLCP